MFFHQVETRAATMMVLELGRLLGIEEVGQMSQHQEDVFRILTPLAKLYTAKQVCTPRHQIPSSNMCSYFCIDVTMIGQIQVCQQSMLTCLDLPYHCDI